VTVQNACPLSAYLISYIIEIGLMLSRSSRINRDQTIKKVSRIHVPSLDYIEGMTRNARGWDPKSEESDSPLVQAVRLPSQEPSALIVRPFPYAYRAFIVALFKLCPFVPG